ncbi:MAG: DUF1127 domain-containing protein [Rhodospirillales bacterium]|nr:DUF1127 domain-containing protein [Rhodospirillales bacterium]MDP6643775.1 DUF1127 domain-containing protein [Rhodospirillales bacterium]
MTTLSIRATAFEVQPVSAGPFFTGFWQWTANLVRRARSACDEHRIDAELRALSAHQLNDIGLVRSEIGIPGIGRFNRK